MAFSTKTTAPDDGNALAFERETRESMELYEKAMYVTRKMMDLHETLMHFSRRVYDFNKNSMLLFRNQLRKFLPKLLLNIIIPRKHPACAGGSLSNCYSARAARLEIFPPMVRGNRGNHGSIIKIMDFSQKLRDSIRKIRDLSRKTLKIMDFDSNILASPLRD